MPVMEEYLTVEEVAQKLRVSVATILREIRRKKLVAHKVGGMYRITPIALQTYLDTYRTDRQENS